MRLFYEEQPFRLMRIRLVLAIPPTILLGLAVSQVGYGHVWGAVPMSNGGLVGLSILLWLVYGWLIRVRLVTVVRPGEIAVRLRGLPIRRRVPVDHVKEMREMTFDPLRDFGGYGIRAVRGGRVAVTGGTHGVRLDLRSGGFVVIGTERAQDLIRAIARAKSDGREGPG